MTRGVVVVLVMSDDDGDAWTEQAEFVRPGRRQSAFVGDERTPDISLVL